MLEKWYANHKQEFLENVKPELIKRKNTFEFIEKEEWESLFPMNSYDYRYIIDMVSDEVLVDRIQHALLNSSFREVGEFSLPKDYDHALIGLYLPILLRRFQELLEQERDHLFFNELANDDGFENNLSKEDIPF